MWWIRVPNVVKKSIEKRHFDEELAFIITSQKIHMMNKDKNAVMIPVKDKMLSVPLTLESIDNLAEKAGVLVGKWLIYRSQPEIDSVWKIVAEATWNGKLGKSAKVSTLKHRKSQFVICIYTHNYLDFEDVERVRDELRVLGFNKKLCYKPDIYTYLEIYYKTTPLSPCRYRM